MLIYSENSYLPTQTTKAESLPARGKPGSETLQNLNLDSITADSPEQWLELGCEPPSSPIIMCVAFNYHENMDKAVAYFQCMGGD